ncbi:hypothetical protein GQ54DRAFT_68836 [Martensiomyces pterosporus]|nr:hypothetical protein GQ54DRAFT_68836 [Martensiomyces pterosporus]
MSLIGTYRVLVEQAVQDTLQAGVIDAQELDTAAVQQATQSISQALANTDESEHRDFEYTFHTLLFDLIQQHASSQDKVQALREILAMLDIATVLSDKEVADPSFVFTLLEETMDMVSIATARDIFAHMETRASTLRKGMTATGGKGIVMLKTCNSLLRRIPHATMSEFAGRVQIFVANSFPLSERSGVNLRGDFDRANIPPVSDAAINEEDEKLYRSFWSLQEYFANPQLAFGEAPESLVEFLKTAKMALDEFRKAGSGHNSHGIAMSPTGNETLKYLTSPRLLRMQFTDPQFKCQVIVQLMIFLKYALSMTGEKLRALKETATNKFVIANFDISKAEQQQLREMQDRAANQLFAVASDRGLFRRSTLFVLIHENNWTKWKAGSCKPFEGIAMPELVNEMKAAAQEFFNIREAQYMWDRKPMGSARMAELWNTSTDVSTLEGLGSEAQSADLALALQKLESYCRTDSDYEFLMPKEQSAADLLQWRALRLSVYDNLFREVNPASKSLQGLREELADERSPETDVEMAEPEPEPAAAAPTEA